MFKRFVLLLLVLCASFLTMEHGSLCGFALYYRMRVACPRHFRNDTMMRACNPREDCCLTDPEGHTRCTVDYLRANCCPDFYLLE